MYFIWMSKYLAGRYFLSTLPIEVNLVSVKKKIQLKKKKEKKRLWGLSEASCNVMEKYGLCSKRKTNGQMIASQS